MAKRKYQDIRDQLFNRLRQSSGKSVAYNHRVATHIGPGGHNLDSFLNVVNKLPLFRADKVFLSPGEVIRNPASQKPNVEELLAAILDDYKDRGWIVYH